MVWAAAFVLWRERFRQNTPSELYRPGSKEELEERNRGDVNAACEWATCCVKELREAERDLERSHGDDSDVCRQYREVIK
jgi:hypothetical protein